MYTSEIFTRQDLGSDIFQLLTMLLYSHSGFNIDMHLYQKYIIISTAFSLDKASTKTSVPSI